MAKARGAEVTAAASLANIEFVRSLGADRVVDRATGTVRGKNVLIVAEA
jgi:NADPH:quinone reductase-like Zn-dependent oxidoreductase